MYDSYLRKEKDRRTGAVVWQRHGSAVKGSWGEEGKGMGGCQNGCM